MIMAEHSHMIKSQRTMRCGSMAVVANIISGVSFMHTTMEYRRCFHIKMEACGIGKEINPLEA